MHELLNSHYKIPFLFLVGFGILIADQAIKYYIRHSGGFYLCNKGASFGLRMPSVLFWFLFFISLFLFFRLLSINKNHSLALAGLFFLIMGALSNGLDKLFSGCIYDYLRFAPMNLPVFNLADVSIFLGSSILIYSLLI